MTDMWKVADDILKIFDKSELTVLLDLVGNKLGDTKLPHSQYMERIKSIG